MSQIYVCDRCKEQSDRRNNIVEIPHATERKYLDLCNGCLRLLSSLIYQFVRG
jgi:hypothetical protein